MSPSPHLRYVLALTTCLSLGLAACSKSPETAATSAGNGQSQDDFFIPPSEFDSNKFVPDGTKSADGKVTKDFAKQTLPTDVYQDIDFTVAINARDLYLHHCLKEKGVDSPKPQPDPPFKPEVSPFSNPVTGEYIFNEQSAARDGYQPFSGEADTGTGPDFPADPFDDFVSKYLGGGDQAGGATAGGNAQEQKQTPEMKNFEDCSMKFEQEFKRPGVSFEDNKSPSLEEQKNDPSYFASSFEFISTPYIDSKAKEWKACMQPLGIPDLPDSPDEMPPESKAKVWHPEDFQESNENAEPVNVDPATGQINDRKVTDDEKAVATKDAQCRTSSGWDRAVYDTKWGLITQHMEENKAGIEQHGKELKAYEEKLKAYIEKN